MDGLSPTCRQTDGEKSKSRKIFVAYGHHLRYGMSRASYLATNLTNHSPNPFRKMNASNNSFGSVSPSARMSASNLNPANSNRPPCLGQIVALSFTYRRLISVWLAFPVVLLMLPIVARPLLFLLNSITKQHGILTVLLTIYGTRSFRELVRKSAPTPQKATESLQSIKGWLPFVMFWGSTMFVRTFGPIFGKLLGISWLLTASPGISFSICVRAAVGMVLLGFGVMGRYIGPSSVGE